MKVKKFSCKLVFLLAFVAGALAICCAPVRAEIFGTVHGIVHDPQHRPIQDAAVDLKAQHSDWVQHQKTNDNGEFDFSAVPLGEYTVTVTLANFQRRSRMWSSGPAQVLCCIFNWSWPASRKKRLSPGKPSPRPGFGHADNASESRG